MAIEPLDENAMIHAMEVGAKINEIITRVNEMAPDGFTIRRMSPEEAAALKLDAQNSTAMGFSVEKINTEGEDQRVV